MCVGEFSVYIGHRGLYREIGKCDTVVGVRVCCGIYFKMNAWCVGVEGRGGEVFGLIEIGRVWFSEACL